MKRHNLSRESGYSLLQMAIALLVIGVLIGTFIGGYDLYKKRTAIQTTEDNVKLAVNSLQRFKQLNGRLPCPASLGAPRGTRPYGVETNCADVSVPPGSTPTPGSNTVGGMDGIGIQLSARTIPATPSAAAYQPRIRYGMLPFRVMNMDEKQAYDAYGNRLYYVMTETLGVRQTANDTQGGIRVIDTNGVSILQPSGNTPGDPADADTGSFVLFSVGPDRAGGYNFLGRFTQACAAAGMDVENCDQAIAPTYRYAVKSMIAGNLHYDDTINYFSELPDTYWVRDENSPENIVDTSPDGVGVGTTAPAQNIELDIANSWSNASEEQQKLPMGTLRASEKVTVNKICPASSVGTDARCFETRNIAGDSSDPLTAGDPDEAGEGMKCPAGYYMNGIAGGKPICDLATVRCNSATQVLKGFDAAGNAICDYKPCKVTQKTNCGVNRNLPVAIVGTYAELIFGSSYTVGYTCKETSNTTVDWVETKAGTGLCSCIEEDVTDHPNCGNYYGGAKCTRVRHRNCPSGTYTLVSNDCAEVCPPKCKAQPSPINKPDPPTACPQYKTGAGIWDTLTFDMGICNYTAVHHDECTCQPQPSPIEEKEADCPNGFEGDGKFRTKVFDMASCSYKNTTLRTDCECNEEEEQILWEDPVCQPWEAPKTKTKIIQVRDGPSCTWGTKTTVSQGTCSSINYTWKAVSSPGVPPQGSPTYPIVNSSCEYKDFTSPNSKACSQSVGSQYEIYECRCLQ